MLVNTGKAEFPADKSQIALTACQAGLVIAQQEFSGPAETLCSALTQSGMRAARYVQVATPVAAPLSNRIAATVS